MRIAVETHGCRLNRAETDAIADRLRAAGHELVDGVETAELYLLNSCAITHQADADARAAIRRAKRDNPEVRVVVTGCHATAEPERLAAMPEVAGVIGNVEKGTAAFDGLLARVGEGASRGPSGEGAPEVGREGGPMVEVSRLTRKLRPPVWEHGPARDVARTRPLLKVQDGCDYQCSFCIVPSVRGRSRSLDLATLGGQLRDLVAAGHPEVVLTGAHLGLWGRDLGERPRLAALVDGLLAAAPGARLRLGSVDPHEVDADLIAHLGAGVDGDGSGLCQYLHLPMQSGDDGVLRAMRRAHSVDDLRELVPALRGVAPDVGLGVDVIVGFPGEDDASFERTRALLESLAIPFAHVFTWSPRSGTHATEVLAHRHPRPDPVRVAERSRILRSQADRARRRFVERQVGRARSAVVLRRRARSGELVALTDNYVRVHLNGDDALLGRRVRVQIEGPDGRRGSRVRARWLPDRA